MPSWTTAIWWKGPAQLLGQPIGFFAPDMRYSATSCIQEFKTMVKTFHSQPWHGGDSGRGLQPPPKATTWALP